MRQERDQLGAERQQLTRERDQLLERVRQLEEREREFLERGLGQHQLMERGKCGPKLLPWSSLESKGKREATIKALEELQNIAMSRDTTMAQVAAHIAYR